MIISASRRTDIPAFYADWFCNRLKEGFIVTRNPFNMKQLSKLHLDNESVDAIVFWTKNARPMLNKLDFIEESGIPYYFQFTITPYGEELEPNLPKDKGEVIEAFKTLARRIGSERVIWRYDPILFNKKYTTGFHVRAFSRCAELLEGSTKKAVISFVDMKYNSTKQIGKLGIGDGSQNEKNSLAATIAEKAAQHGIAVESCSEELNLQSCGISHGHCIDATLIERISGKALDAKGRRKDRHQRLACGCISSTDIGAYNTCLHNCAYCYANYSPKTIVSNSKSHNPNSPVLIGSCNANSLEFKKASTALIEKSRQPGLFEI